MKATAGCVAAFGPLLELCDREPPQAAANPRGGPATSDGLLHSLIRFEGALAWEGGQPRHAVPAMVLPWAAEAWMAGWDDADARFCHADLAYSGR